MVVGIAFLFWYTFGGGETAVERQRPDTFKCDACDAIFEITKKEMMDDNDLYMKYFGKFGEALPCQMCDETQAYRVYYCTDCEEYYKYSSEQGFGGEVATCPEGHEILSENQFFVLRS